MPATPNLLMICVDDLSPLLRCHGHAEMHTPHLDRLAARGTRFTQNYCQVPVCGASRCSVLTGTRPTPQRFTNYNSRADREAPGVPTLLHQLKDHGYRLAGDSKVLHQPQDHADVWDAFNDGLHANHTTHWHSDDANRLALEGARAANSKRPRRGPAYECVDVPDTAHHDGAMCQWALRELEQLAADDDTPFALCFGSINVHLPFKAPKKYWDLYDPNALPLHDHTRRPNDVPRAGLPDSGELRHYGNIPRQGPVSEQQARDLSHGYRAGVSYLDAQVGHLLDALDRLGLTDQTAVALWVDHGFSLGEHGVWGKHCLYEAALKVPLIIAPPGNAGPRGQACNTVTENLDLFPTLCDVLGLDTPDHLQGRSLAPLLDDVNAPRDAFAVSRFGNGDSLRDERYRYAEWRRGGDIIGRVLFDIEQDPHELNNIADDPEQAHTLHDMHARLTEISAQIA